MTGCYLNTLPREFMRGVADFDPDYPGCYFVPRGSVIPPPSLRERVWPRLNHWLAVYSKHPNATETVGPSMATEAVLEAIDHLRDVFLQVSNKFL